MERPKVQPSPSPLVAVKRDPDAAELSVNTPAPVPHKRRCLEGQQPVTPTQLPLSPLLTPQIIQSGSSIAVLTPPTATAVKREPDSDDGAEAGAVGKQGPRDLSSFARPAAAEPPSVWLNRTRLGRILHELARAHRWREAAGVVSTLLRAPRNPGSFEETRNLFVVAMETYKRLAGNNGAQQGSRSRYYLRTQKLFDVWMRKLNWLPTSPKKDLVKLELALFYLSQGNIDNAYNATRALIGREGLQKEPILNLIHGLISYDKWYSGLPKDMQVEEFDVYNESSANSMASDGCEESDFLDNSDENSISVHDTSLHACSSESSVNNKDIDRKMNTKPFFAHVKEENESMIDKDFRSIFVNNSDGPTCRLDKSLLPLRLNPTTEISNDCFDSYWRYKSAPNSFYEDAEKCLRLALHSNPPVTAALLPLVQSRFLFPAFAVVQLLLLGDKLKDALNDLERTCNSSSTALPFR
ncbi:hypothetical protein PR202_ga17583 [Eleusine coracana subsp. coracana]|uniref:Uncharacterized protein n=1 Tax=Eleusine coracana subsp. coracana TaxID=191504 RepID=A0AAV5CQI6_ELECO|nr:hypothetical protein PR202_ga17336 [Eleusine coracana subsp. coracana]GJN00404.1 hypothetical protein PR202_ga17583 [Eleusine coracana subsp. coracana]